MDEFTKLKDCFVKLNDRVKSLEGQMTANDTSIEHITTKLNEISAKMTSFENNLVFWQRIGSFISPVVAGVIVVIVQHFFFH